MLPGVDNIAVLLLVTPDVEAGGTDSEAETRNSQFVNSCIGINCLIHSRCVRLKSGMDIDVDSGGGTYSSSDII